MWPPTPAASAQLIPVCTCHPPSALAGTVVGTHTATAGTQTIDLDIVALNDSLAIALLMTIDEKIGFIEKAGSELATALKKAATGRIDVVVSAATLGIPVGQAVASALKHERQVVLQKTAKIHLQSTPYAEPLTSITTGTPQKMELLQVSKGFCLAGRRARSHCEPVACLRRLLNRR